MMRLDWWSLFLGIFGFVLFVLFFSSDQGFLISEKAFNFGVFLPRLNFTLPWVGAGFILLSIALYLKTRKLARPKTQAVLGIIIILFSFLVNGFVSQEPVVNIAMIMWLIICASSLFWEESLVNKKWTTILLFLGVLNAFFQFQEGEILASLPVFMIILWFWIVRKETTKKSLKSLVTLVLLTVCALSMFEAYLLFGPILGLSLWDLLHRKKFFLRKAKLVWILCLVFVFIGILAWWTLLSKQNLILGFGEISAGILGNGFSQNLYSALSQKTEVQLFGNIDLTINGWGFLWQEWGIVLFPLMMGNVLIWWSLFQKQTYSLVFLFVSVVFLMPGILTLPAAWLLLSFFTWNNSFTQKRESPVHS